ncbi:MAG: hypothetical protein JOZ08_20515 [Verrucomicrobia bacterium]|nr:hypothetical protein [Verrucomicrobiota bacterium]
MRQYTLLLKYELSNDTPHERVQAGNVDGNSNKAPYSNTPSIRAAEFEDDDEDENEGLGERFDYGAFAGR